MSEIKIKTPFGLAPRQPTPGEEPEKSEFRCHERRHMTASEFVTYDTIRAMAKSNKASSPEDLVFYGRLSTLANYTNRSINAERRNIESLVRKGWLIPAARTRWRAGRWGTNRYSVVEHEWYIANATAYAQEPSQCPPYRYDVHTGKPVKKGMLKSNVERDPDTGQLVASLGVFEKAV